MLCRIASTGKSKKHADRNLRRCILKAGASLQIDLVLVPTTITLRKPKLRTVKMFWPTLSMRSWLQILLESYPRIALGGHRLHETQKWQQLFAWFWQQYKEIDEHHPVYSLEGANLSWAIPIMIHGDEGRGLRSQAFMVQSWQFVISHLGPDTTNTSGQLICKYVCSTISQ